MARRLGGCDAILHQELEGVALSERVQRLALADLERPQLVPYHLRHPGEGLPQPAEPHRRRWYGRDQLPGADRDPSGNVVAARGAGMDRLEPARLGRPRWLPRWAR